MSSSIQNWAVILKPKRLHMIEVSCGEKKQIPNLKACLVPKAGILHSSVVHNLSSNYKDKCGTEANREKDRKTDRVD